MHSNIESWGKEGKEVFWGKGGLQDNEMNQKKRNYLSNGLITYKWFEKIRLILMLLCIFIFYYAINNV